jgi:1,4-alpha-glucan branching enzyme
MVARRMSKTTTKSAQKKMAGGTATSRVKGTIRRSLEREIAFSFFAPLAQAVQVAGTFNGWNPSLSPLVKDTSGNWQCALKLKPGKYEYRFVIDGRWENDQKNSECVQNEFGEYNCLLEVT